MIKIKRFLDELELGKGEGHRNLMMFPLVTSADGDPGYLTLGMALENGLARISEVSEGGSVPELQFSNRAELPVLIVDGEEMVGAKQNRVANLTIMAPAKTTIVIPVSCVEAGRWRFDRDDFVASERAHFVRGRAAKVATVSGAMHRRGSRRSDQERVWADISAKAARMEVHAPTQAMADIYEHHHTVAEADAESYPAVGLGTDIRLSARGLVGAGLVHEDVLVHLAAFAQGESNHKGPSGDRGVVRMSQRRRSFERR